MTLLAVLSLHLLSLLYITHVLQAESPPITCEAGTFTAGEPASITCDFRTDVETVGRDIGMAKFPLDEQRGHLGEDVLLCPISKETKKHLCSIDLEMATYMFDGTLKDRLTVRIPEVLPEHEGWYKCFYLPAGGTEAHPCSLRVQDTREDSKVLSTLLPISLIVILVCVLAFIFFRRRRVGRWLAMVCRAPDTECQDSVEAMIPTSEDKVEPYLRDFQFSCSKAEGLQATVVVELGKGLGERSKEEADTRMLLTYVCPLPDESRTNSLQNNKRTTLVLELTDTHLKASLVTLEGRVASIVESRQYKRSLLYNILRGGKVTELFDFIADWTENFLEDEILLNNTPLVLILAFPCRHQSVREARLVKWTKEVKTKHLKGVDSPGIHGLLEKALIKRARMNKLIPRRMENLRKLKLVSIVNDTVSTLMSVADSDTHSNCRIALILDTGLNACYLEDWKHLHGLNTERLPEMVINTELGALGENGCLEFCRTEFDRELDEQSTNPGSQILEKMVSGRYLGEIVRLTLKGLKRERLVFQSFPLGCTLFQHGTFTTEFVIIIESDREEPYLKTRGILDALGVTSYTEDDMETVRRVCSVVSERAAFLTAACLAALINHVDQPEVTVVVDGYLYNRHPRFHDLMCTHLQTSLNEGISFSLVSPRHDRAVGAHIAAALQPPQ